MRSLPLLALLWLIVVSMAAPAVAVVRDDGTRILNADSRGVSLEIRTGEPRLRTVPGEPGLSELDLPGFSATGGEGEPALPARIVWVGIPEGVTVRVEAT